MAVLVLKYPDILRLFGVHTMKERTESRAFLAWFLENYYRLDQMEVGDCICDGNYDKGIDGIYVNEQLGQVDVFQATIVKKEGKTIGDTMLKEFEGTLSQFKDRSSVDNLIATSKNPVVASLLKALDISAKVEEGFTVRGVFITNAQRDQNAIDFLAANDSIIMFDKGELLSAYAPLDKTPPIAPEITFDVSSVPYVEYQLSADVNMVIAPLPALDLLKMGGIASQELFAPNVRMWLGRKTKVNKDIDKSIKNPRDHQLFPAFHNGITILCNKMSVSNDKIKISGYAVVNGCQSLNSLYENRKDVSADLRIITKFLDVPPEDPFARTITDRTNNQNGTTFRDLQSNNPIQIRLQSEIHRKYIGQQYYRIKRGEHPDWPVDKVIENELAARILLAFDLKQPSSCHQSYKLFDELHTAIFGRPEVTADRVVFVADLLDIVVGELDTMKNELFGKYNLTRFFVVYLIRESLETDKLGKELCANPSKFIVGDGSRQRLRESLEEIVRPVVKVLDKEVTRRGVDEYFDFKSDLKSPKKIAELTAMIVSHYEIVTGNEYARTFTQAWTKRLPPASKAPAPKQAKKPRTK